MGSGGGPGAYRLAHPRLMQIVPTVYWLPFILFSILSSLILCVSLSQGSAIGRPRIFVFRLLNICVVFYKTGISNRMYFSVPIFKLCPKMIVEKELIFLFQILYYFSP